MAKIDAQVIYKEMENMMQNIFQGTEEKRYKQAKKLFLESVEETIEANKEDLLKTIF